MYVVYKHTTPSGKVYIGITSQKPEKRWHNGNGYKRNKHFYRAILKYGWENIKHEIIENGLTKQQACDLEIKLIAEYHARDPRKGYNISTGGEAGSAGRQLSTEARRKISEANKGKNKGKTPWNKGIKGQKPWNKGAHLSTETRKKLSESHKRAYLNPELRREIGEAGKGRTPWNKGKKGAYHHSSETRRKMSDAHKGKTAKAVFCVETGILYISGREAAKSTGVTPSAINNVLRGKAKTAGGYHWRYAEVSNEE